MKSSHFSFAHPPFTITAKQKQHYHATVTTLYVRGNAITRNV